MQKLYCYVDESGLESAGKLFVVAVVITDENRDNCIQVLEGIEKETKKGRRKWVEVRAEIGLSYMRAVLNTEQFKGKLNYAVYKNTTEFLSRTVLTTARAIIAQAESDDYKASIYVDGLPASLINWFGKSLRELHIKTRKVRGVRKEETDALIRLADALAGLARQDALGSVEHHKLLEKAKKDGYVREL